MVSVAGWGKEQTPTCQNDSQPQSPNSKNPNLLSGFSMDAVRELTASGLK